MDLINVFAAIFVIPKRMNEILFAYTEVYVRLIEESKGEKKIEIKHAEVSVAISGDVPEQIKNVLKQNGYVQLEPKALKDAQLTAGNQLKKVQIKTESWNEKMFKVLV